MTCWLTNKWLKKLLLRWSWSSSNLAEDQSSQQKCSLDPFNISLTWAVLTGSDSAVSLWKVDFSVSDVQIFDVLCFAFSVSTGERLCYWDCKCQQEVEWCSGRETTNKQKTLSFIPIFLPIWSQHEPFFYLYIVLFGKHYGVSQ